MDKGTKENRLHQTGKEDRTMEKLRKRWENRDWGLLNIGIYMTDDERTEAFNREASSYCSQNDGDCESCSLVNYGLDCHNNAIQIN